MKSPSRVSDDWTKNWHASVAVKISAVVIWLLVVVSLGLIIYQLSSLKSDLLTSQKNEADQIAYHVANISGKSLHSGDSLNSQFAELVKKHSFIALTIEIDNSVYKIGNFKREIELHETREISFHSKDKKFKHNNGYAKAKISTYSIPSEEIIKDKRRKLIVISTVVLLSFAALLTWIINRIVTKPINYLVEATRSISAGKLETRLSLERHDEFGQLTDFFNSMLSTIENKQKELQLALQNANAATRTKSDFLANMSHEIRTPLTAIIGFSKTLQDENLDPHMRSKAISLVIRNGELLLSIINDILDLTKIEANKLEINKQPFSIFKLLFDIDSLLSIQAVDKGLTFNVDYYFPLPDEILSDDMRIKQVLINLCSNAIKFTERGAVSINVSFDSKNEQLIFEIVDSGIGLSDEQMERIFSPFTQADSSTTRKYGGSGLGLSISNHLATLLDGSLEVVSKKGLGSKFTFAVGTGAVDQSCLLETIPEAEQYDVLKNDQVSKNIVTGEVLLVEDTTENQILISYYLQEMGATPTVVENGQLALDIAESNDFDLILMDMQMPVMGGVEAVKLLRSRGYSKPIAMLTANAMKQFEKESRDAGCDDFLVKPIDIEALQAVVQKHLEKNEQELKQTIKDVKRAESKAIISTLNISSEKLRKLVNDFINNLPSYLSSLEKGIENNDFLHVSQEAHKLKGVSGSYGFAPIMQVSDQIEKAAIEKEHEKIIIGMKELNQIVSRVHL